MVVRSDTLHEVAVIDAEVGVEAPAARAAWAVRRDRHDAINQRSWSQAAAFNWLGSLQGFTDLGEQAAYWRIADVCRDQPILDMGVGSGRTVPLLRSLSSHYVAIDYLPAMVAATRRKFPFLDVQVADARNLSRFAPASFSLVAFSFMGIDAVDHAGRQEVLREVHRVLRPGGIFWFSTLNKEGRAFRERPWRPHWPGRSSRGTLHYAVDVVHSLKALPRTLVNYVRHCRSRRDGDGWAEAPFAAHDFGLMVHFISPARQTAELEQHGFRSDPELIDNDTGAEIHSRRPGDVYAFNVLARKPDSDVAS